MSMIKWRPFADLEDLWEFKKMRSQDFDLAHDMYEKDGNIIVTMNVPGIDAEDINVHVDNNELHVSAERKEKKEVNDKDYYHKEIKYGSVSRFITLPCAVDESGIVAELSDGGVLTITLPKIEQEETKKIKVMRR
ncbi:MAG TPA: Hsp20/alpha crystallin family protein [Candidatus Babeliales bacterium]|nr:Hsp20/alpha crystallin family protein [Candidatus Babeliales bacterium]